MPDTAATERPALKPFAGFVIEQPVLHDDLSTELAALVLACQETGKKGTLTLKVDVEPNKDEVTVSVSGEVTTKIPRAKPRASLFYTDEHGNLLRDNPRQPELPLREVAGGKANDQRDTEGATA